MAWKDNSLGHILEKWGFFFYFYFVAEYFLDIFSEPPKSMFTNKLRNCSFLTKLHKNNRPSVSFYNE